MRMSGIFLSAAFAVLFVVAGQVYPVAAHELPKGFSGYADPAGCGSCHKLIYEEWKGSMHAVSSKFGDPVHSAVHDAFAAAMTAKGKKPNYHCANCHTPTADNMAALMTGEAAPDPDDPTDRAGVTCSFCHMVDEVIPGEKFNTYRVSEGIKGPDADSQAPHGALKWGFDKSYEMCLGCHGKKVGGKGGVICSMEEEGIADCIPCHLPKADGPPATGSDKTEHAFHGMFGGHQDEMLRKGASVKLAAGNGRLTVTLENPNPHSFPSTNPLRVAYVKVEVNDGSGTVIFTNFKKDPSEDPSALLVKLFRAGDKVGVPSWEAEGVAKDTRLGPGEVRVIEYPLPKGAKSATATLYYRLMAPKAIEKFGIVPDGSVEKPHVVSRAGIEL
jgi:nitrate reductase cytochrome c-type subunit